MTSRSISIGLAGALGPDTISRLAPIIEEQGFTSLWVNDTPTGDALAALAASASRTATLRLATGVLPLDRWGAESITARLADLPADRLVLGLGSGARPVGALNRVSEAVAALRADAPGVQLIVGALGPKMRALGAEIADGLLLSWLSPSVAADQADELHSRNADARAVLYVRTALDPAAQPRLEREAAQYASYPNYAANFRRLGLVEAQTILSADTFDRDVVRYADAVDELVLRVIAVGDEFEELARFVERAAERIRASS